MVVSLILELLVFYTHLKRHVTGVCACSNVPFDQVNKLWQGFAINKFLGFKT